MQDPKENPRATPATPGADIQTINFNSNTDSDAGADVESDDTPEAGDSQSSSSGANGEEKETAKEQSSKAKEKDDVIEELTPWPDPVEGHKLLEEITRTVKRYVALPLPAARAVALWVIHTYAHEAARCSPILAITSPDKRCGKTTLMSVLSALVFRPLPASNVTSASLYRVVKALRPTLIIDEADTFIRGNSELRGILNSGHTRGTAYVLRCTGDAHTPTPFNTYAPKAIACIGKLPSTLADRSIEIHLERRRRDEHVERIPRDLHSQLLKLRQQFLRFAIDNIPQLKVTEPLYD